MGSFGTVHAIGGYPMLAVKEIQLDDQIKKLMEATEIALATISKRSYLDAIRHYQVLRDAHSIVIVMDRWDRCLRMWLPIVQEPATLPIQCSLSWSRSPSSLPTSMTLTMSMPARIPSLCRPQGFRVCRWPFCCPRRIGRVTDL